MVDEKGKLFGKINLVDFLIILVIIFAVIFLALRIFGIFGGRSNEEVPVRITIVATEVPDYVIDYIVKGEEVWDFGDDIVMGEVEGFEVGDPQGYFYDLNGNMQHIKKEDHSSIELTLIGEAEIDENGAIMEHVTYGVGHSLTLFAGKAKKIGRAHV